MWIGPPEPGKEGDILIPKQGSKMGLVVVVRGMGGEPQDQQAGTSDLQSEACFLLGL